MRPNTKGFTIIEGLLIIVALAIIGFTGWKVYTANQNATDTLNKSDDVADQEITSDKNNNIIQEINTTKTDKDSILTNEQERTNEVIVICEQKQAEETAPQDFNCLNINLVDDSVEGFVLYDEGTMWMLVMESNGSWDIALWSSKNDNPSICDTGSGNQNLVDYCNNLIND